MVLRGVQFQRSGPAGCAFLTRRALSSYHAAFAEGRSGVVCMYQESRMTHGQRYDFTAEISADNLTKDSRRMAREGDLCHGDIGGL